MEKLCIFCKNFKWKGFNYVHYSTLTGGDLEGGASCAVGKFFERRPDDDEELRALLLTAESCPDYAPPYSTK